MAFDKVTVGKRLWILTFFSFFTLLAVQVVNQINTKDLTKRMLELGHTDLPAIRFMTLADMMHDGLRAVVYRAIVTANTADKEGFEDAKSEYAEFSKNINEHLDNIAKTGVSDDVKKEVKDSLPDVQNYVKAGETIIGLIEAKQIPEATAQLPKYQEAFKALEEKFEKLGDHIEASAQKSVTESEISAAKSEKISIGLAVVGCVLLFAFSTFMNRSLIKSLEGIVSRLSTQAKSLKNQMEEINSSSENLSTTTLQQSQSLQLTASAIEEINSMVSKTAEGSEQLEQSSKSSFDVVQEGRSAVSHMLEEISAIKASNEEVLHQIEESNSQIKNITKVINQIGEKTKVINDIVFQTKLLSFNASVEAARAGEYGKGFSVVAEEVGNLAQMSGTASKEISQMLDESIKQVESIVSSNRDNITRIIETSSEKINQGVDVANKCNKVFEQIVSQVGTVSTLSGNISSAIDEQSAGVSEINKAINTFNQSNTQNVKTAEDISGVASELKDSFIELNELMHELDTLVSNKNTEEDWAEDEAA